MIRESDGWQTKPRYVTWHQLKIMLLIAEIWGTAILWTTMSDPIQVAAVVTIGITALSVVIDVAP